MGKRMTTVSNITYVCHFKKWLLIQLFLLGIACTAQDEYKINDSINVERTLEYEDNFDSNLDNWIVEQMPGGNVRHSSGKMEIEDKAGCTIWFNKKLQAPLTITYEALVIDNGGPNDRASDLNCFWLASDPTETDYFFGSNTKRTGKFSDYDHLKLYYVGLGGHNNTKTRFRRYVGDGSKPLLPENDLSASEYLIVPNRMNKIKIVVYNGVVRYYRNEQLIFDFLDKDAYSSGYFGIRTVNNHMKIDNFKVYSLKAQN